MKYKNIYGFGDRYLHTIEESTYKIIDINDVPEGAEVTDVKLFDEKEAPGDTINPEPEPPTPDGFVMFDPYPESERLADQKELEEYNRRKEQEGE